MGVYHLMGLGLSAGTVIGPLSYLAQRYTRWNTEDQQFFERSGERKQRKEGEKVGDVQALVLFTTREALYGERLALKWIDNPPGKAVNLQFQSEEPLKPLLRRLLQKEWLSIVHQRQNKEVTREIFWCEVDRRDINLTYERIIQVIAALRNVGGQGKEIWVNLTGGNNVANFALDLAATLSGDVARLYYVQAENEVAEKCIRFTSETSYWVELPVMPLTLNPVNQVILDLMDIEIPCAARKIHSELLQHGEYWNLIQDYNTFFTTFLEPMWRQGLIIVATGKSKEESEYIIGSQWKLIKPYQERLEFARSCNLTLEQLAQQEIWIEREEINLTR